MSTLSRYSKLLGAILGGLTPAVVVWILALAGVHVDQSVAAGICTVLAGLGAYLAPPNTPPAPATPPAAPVPPAAG
jgi:hypothetical protein